MKIKLVLLAVLISLIAFAQDKAKEKPVPVPLKNQVELLKAQHDVDQIEKVRAGVVSKFQDAINKAFSDANISKEDYAINMDSMEFVLKQKPKEEAKPEKK